MSNEEKQIEEMVCNACITKPTCTDMEKAKCMRRNFAICVIKQGYRKASDVAREIFTEIDKILDLNKCYGDCGIYFDTDIRPRLVELEKKYGSEGKE